MKHPLYDTWLFDPENLTTEQGEALKQHLSDCADCRSLFDAWHTVEGRMLAAEPVAPKPGFTIRWQLRLPQALARRRRRQIVAVLAPTASIALALSVVLGMWLWAGLSAPTDVALAWLARLQVISASLEALRGFLPIAVRALQNVHALWWVAMALAGLWFSGLWAGLLYRVAFKTIPNGVSK